MNNRWWGAYVGFCVIAPGLVQLANSQTPQPGFCGDCWCIPVANKTCPVQPATNFSTFLTKLLEFVLENPLSLDCDPYEATDSSICELTPNRMTNGGACIIDFSEPADGSTCPQNWSYSLITFPGSIEEAQSQGLYVTHGSPCGACSSLQDLFVYMDKGDSIRAEATTCGIQGISSVEAGIQCFQDLGFSSSCAILWNYNTQNTQEFCVDKCADFFFANEPNNGPPPSCMLADCIECDEVFSGPIFQKFAGRTRRSSGLLSGIARNCSEVLNVIQVDPCAHSHSQMESEPSDSSVWPLSILSLSTASITTVMLLLAG